MEEKGAKKRSKAKYQIEKLSKKEANVTLPSGLVIKIKKITPLMFGKIYDGTAEGLDLTYRVIEKCSLVPKLRPLEIGDDGLGEGEQSFDEVDLGDFLELGNAITKFSGIDDATEEGEDFQEGGGTEQ